MTEFTRGKITFAIGLLAVLFALAPFLTDYGHIGFDLLGFNFSLRRLYGFLAGTWAISVYCYGFQFITERKLRLVAAVGDAFYVVALILPVAYLGLLAFAMLVTLLKPVIAAPWFAQVVLNIASTVGGALSVLAGIRLQRSLAVKQRAAEAAGRESLSLASMRRAEELLSAGSPDLAVIAAFRALEIASADISADDKKNWFHAMRDIVPKALRGRLDAARDARNAAAHTAEPISISQARETIDTVDKVLAILADYDSWECPRCGAQMELETGSDHGFNWSRKRCPKCKYLSEE